jgi:long-chain-fatty-acid--CoA ligase ACSBG
VLLAHGGRPALGWRAPPPSCAPRRWLWREYSAAARAFASACVAPPARMAAREVVAVLASNSPAWAAAALGALCAGCAVTGIYASSSPAAAAHIAAHSRARVIVCEGGAQLAKFARCALPDARVFVVASRDGGGGPDADARAALAGAGLHAADFSAPVLSWDDFVAAGRADGGAAARAAARAAAAAPGDVAMLVYTSGTMAAPKAVEITHDNAVFVARSVLSRFAAFADDSSVSFLPLSHIAAAMLDLVAPLLVGFCVTFAEPDAMRGALVNTLRDVQPTIFFGVPRVYEKMQEKMVEVGARSGACVAALARWAKRVGAAAAAADAAGAPPPAPCALALARALVFAPVRRALGLARARILVSAAAPMQPSVLAYFDSLGMPVHEVYGMSECTGPATACLPGSRRVGTAGVPLPGMELATFAVPPGGDAGAGPRLPPGAEGEVAMRGRHIMRGYRDDGAATARAIDADGWLHSGDLGVVDADGFLRITGRIKELVKTSGGENVPPLLIENEVKDALRDVVSQVVLIGDRRKFLAVLLTLRSLADVTAGLAAGAADAAVAGAARTGAGRVLDGPARAAFAAAGSAATTVDEAAACPAARAYIDAGVARANARALSRACVVQRWRVLPDDLSIAGGELTATLKIRRSEVAKKFAAEIEQLYA